MVFQIQIYIEFFCYSMWPVKSQNYKLSYVRSKNIDFECISFLRDDEIRQNVIVLNKANLHFFKSSKIWKIRLFSWFENVSFFIDIMIISKFDHQTEFPTERYGFYIWVLPWKQPYVTSIHTYTLCKWYFTYRGFVTYCVTVIRKLRKGLLVHYNIRKGWSSRQ